MFGASMIFRQLVKWDGTEYLLLVRSTGPATKAWAWVDAERRNPVSPAEVTSLRDAFLDEPVIGLGRPVALLELRRFYEALVAMGAPQDKILKRFGTHEPRKCVDCKKLTIDGYAGPRCKPCYEHFVRTARVRNAGLYSVQGGRMSGAR